MVVVLYFYAKFRYNTSLFICAIEKRNKKKYN